MALLDPAEDPQKKLLRSSFTAAGTPRSESDEIAIVKGAWEEAQTWLGQEASYKLEWGACKTIYRSPRPYSFWEGSYVLEPNLRRFDVAKWCNSITAQVMQALFSEDPPVVINPGPTMTVDSARAWEVLIGRLMKEAGPGTAKMGELPGLRHGFKEEFNLGVEQWALQGTGCWMYYTQEEEQCFETRMSSKVKLPDGTAATKKGPPEIQKTYKNVQRLKFEFIDLDAEDCIVWDPQASGGDIRLARWTVRRRMLDFYQLQQLALDPNYDIPGAKITGQYAGLSDTELLRDERDEELVIAGSLIDLFFEPAETDDRKGAPVASQIANASQGVVHGAKPDTAVTSNPLMAKLEVLEYLDQQNNHVITVLQQKRRIRSGTAEFGYLSGNYLNLPNAILGMGVGQIGANNQQLSQWIVNSALKVLAISLNAPHLAPDTIGQSPRVLRIGTGKVLTVTEQAFQAGGMKLLDTNKVDPSIWPVLQESNKEGESATGADSLMVQGSSAGPRAGIGRTAGGAGIMASKSEGRLDGPMDHLITQVFLPFVAAMIWFVFHKMSDPEIIEILTEELGQPFVDKLDLENFHNAKFGYDVLIGAKLGALRNLAQSLVLMFEYGMNPEMQQFLADVHGTTIDVQTIYKLLLLVSHCGTGVASQIIRPLTPKEEARNKQKQQMAAQMGPGGKLASIQAQGQQDAALEDKKAENRLMEHVIDRTLEASTLPGTLTGAPSSSSGLQGE